MHCDLQEVVLHWVEAARAIVGKKPPPSKEAAVSQFHSLQRMALDTATTNPTTVFEIVV